MAADHSTVLADAALTTLELCASNCNATPDGHVAAYVATIRAELTRLSRVEVRAEWVAAEARRKAAANPICAFETVSLLELFDSIVDGTDRAVPNNVSAQRGMAFLATIRGCPTTTITLHVGSPPMPPRVAP